MKTNIFLLACYFICSSFSSVHKVNTDYRDPYVGNYYCKANCIVPNTEHSALTTVTAHLTINVAEDAIDSVLDITLNVNTYKVKLKSGILYAYPSGSPWRGQFYSTDSLSFSVTPGLGPNTCSYKGKLL